MDKDETAKLIWVRGKILFTFNVVSAAVKELRNKIS